MVEESKFAVLETSKIVHELIGLHRPKSWDPNHEIWVDIARNEKGEVISVTIGDKGITVFELEILEWLKEQGKI